MIFLSDDIFLLPLVPVATKLASGGPRLGGQGRFAALLAVVFFAEAILTMEQSCNVIAYVCMEVSIMKKG